VVGGTIRIDHPLRDRKKSGQVIAIFCARRYRAGCGCNTLVSFNPEIDIICELIGGDTNTKELVLAAIAHGKHVVNGQ
jgi:homoserine dehydrogenase